MSRLTDYKGHYCFMSCYENNKSQIREECPQYNVCYERKMYDKLCEYEDLEEQGRLIELPCKIGETIWELDEYPSGFEIQPATVERVALKELAGTYIYYIYLSFPKKKDSLIHCYGFDDFGTILFLTKEEAEAKLTKLKGE